VEPNQVHLVAAAVLCDSQQFVHALEPRFTGQIVGDVGDGNRRNRLHHDVAVVHPVATTHLDMGTRPDANAASDSPAPDSLAKVFGEQHVESWRSRPLEYPQIVLVSATAAELFRRSKSAPAVLQLIPKGEGHLSG
jgi:hypothetical protein